MDYLHAIVMGIIQGLTEFLPVSSSAHLALYPKIFGVNSELLKSVAYDVALHGGTLAALLIFFRKKIIKLVFAFFQGISSAKNRQESDFKISIYIIAGTIPAVVVGYLFGDIIESTFRAPIYMAGMLIVFGLVLMLADKFGKKQKDMQNIKLIDALMIGTAQVFALIPGISRSGITITAGLFAGYKRQDAAEFSFLLSIPVVLGAFVMQAKKFMKEGPVDNMVLIILGFAAAFISGILAIKFLLDFVSKKTFTPFVIYRLILGGVILVFFIR
ncbi:MAG: undecaprenyl-diphosphate phosphatase [bacterium]